MSAASQPISKCITDLRVRYTECDPMGVAHHTAYPVWFEMGRTELLRASGFRYRDMEEQGFFMAVAAMQVKYKAPARYDDELMLETTLKEIGRVRLEHEYRLLRDGLILATASTTLVCLDRNGRMQGVPESILEAAGKD
jgi:acyl-CoA thioester hydrolase